MKVKFKSSKLDNFVAKLEKKNQVCDKIVEEKLRLKRENSSSTLKSNCSDRIDNSNATKSQNYGLGYFRNSPNGFKGISEIFGKFLFQRRIKISKNSAFITSHTKISHDSDENTSNESTYEVPYPIMNNLFPPVEMRNSTVEPRYSQKRKDSFSQKAVKNLGFLKSKKVSSGSLDTKDKSKKRSSLSYFWGVLKEFDSF